MPSLPILSSNLSPTNETLVRYFHQTNAKWSEHLAHGEQLEAGTAWCNPELPRSYAANRVLDVALPATMAPQQAVEEVTRHFDGRGSTCWQWVMNPSAPRAQTEPMAEHLVSLGYRPDVMEILYLNRAPSPASAPPGTKPVHAPLTIIPARASFRHARAIHDEENADRYNEPSLAEAAMLHLDDPHYDALLALKDGEAVAHVGVLAVGEIGLIEEVYVTKSLRGQGVGTTMMMRALEICARSLFKHVLLGVAPDNAAAKRLYGRFGFEKIGESIEFLRP